MSRNVLRLAPLVGLLVLGCASSSTWPSKGSIAPKRAGIDRRVVDKDEVAALLNDNPTALARKAKEGEPAMASAGAEPTTPATGGGPEAKAEIELEPIMKKAIEALEKKDLANAEKHAKEVIAEDPKGWPYAFVVLGDVALERGDYAKALEHYNKAMELDPKDGWAAQRAAQALVKLKKPQDARALLRKFVDGNADADADTWDALAWMELEAGDLKKAEAAFRKAIEASGGKDAEAWYGLALIAAKRQDAVATEKALSALFDLQPERRLVLERDPTFFRMRIHPNVRALFSDKKMAEAKAAAEKKKKGLPTATAAPSLAWKLAVPGGAEKTIADMIRFDFDSAVIKPESKGTLDEIAAFLKSEGKGVELVEITGHADRRGDDVYNIKLSEQRANAVRLALIQRGVSASLLKSKGYGNYCPLDDGEDESAYAKNRRVQFAVSAGGKISGEELTCTERMRKWLKPDAVTAKLVSFKK